MTACLLITPNGIPTIMSDIVVTYGDVERAARPIKSRSGNSSPEAIIHARKLHIITPNTCVSAAGDAHQIARFIDDLRGNINAFEKEERPAKLIAQLANSYKGIAVVASYAKVTPEGIIENHTYHVGANVFEGKPEYYESDVFGFVKVSGSGGKALYKMLCDYEVHARQNLEKTKAQLSDKYRVQYPDRDPKEWKFALEAEAAHNLSLAVCEGIITQYMVKELNELERAGHGGFFEYAMFNPSSNCWEFRPSALYRIAKLEFRGENEITGTSVVGPTVIYQSIEEGGLINVIGDETSVFHLCVSPSQPFVDGGRRNPFLEPWKPDRIVLAFVRENKNGHLRFLLSRVLNSREHHLTSYRYDEKLFSFSVKTRLLAEIFGSRPTHSSP